MTAIISSQSSSCEMPTIEAASPIAKPGERAADRVTRTRLNQLRADLAASNARKVSGTRTVVFLLATHDPTGTLLTPESCFNLMRIAETHRVAVHCIRSADEVHAVLQQDGRDAELVIINAHGSPNSIYFADESTPCKASDLTASHFTVLPPDARIILVSCKTGQEFAPRLAEITQRTVVASNKNVYKNDYVARDQEEGWVLTSTDAANRSSMRRFLPSGEERPSSPEVEERHKLLAQQYFVKHPNYFSYIQEKALQKDIDAQITLAFLYSSNKILASGQSQRSATIKWMLEAAEGGHPIALWLVGKNYESGSIPLKEGDTSLLQAAVGCYTKAVLFYPPDQKSLDEREGLDDLCRLALGGCKEAECALADLCQQGYTDAALRLGEIFASRLQYEQAIHFYTIAAKGNSSAAEAAFALAKFMEEGKGASPNPEKAAFEYFLLSCYRDHRLAKEALVHLAETGNCAGRYYLARLHIAYGNIEAALTLLKPLAKENYELARVTLAELAPTTPI